MDTHRFYRAVPLLVVGTLLNSCGNRTGSGFSPSLPNLADPVTAPGDQSTLADEVSSSAVPGTAIQCPSQSACSRAIGVVTARLESGEVRTCVGFLVGPSLAVTSTHCRTPISTSTKNIRLSFPRIDELPEESVFGEEIVVQSQDDNESLTSDYLFFRLDRQVRRDPLVISTAGLEDNAKVTLASLGRLPDSSSWSIQQSDCIINARSFALPNFNNERNPLGTISGCSQTAVMLGAPLLDEYGRVIGIYRETFAPDPAQVAFIQSQTRSEVWPPIHLISNFSCIGDPNQLEAFQEAQGSESSPCQMNRRRVDIRTMQNLFKPSEGDYAISRKEIERQIFEWNERESKKIRWEIAPKISDPANHRMLNPLCFWNPTEWLHHYKRPALGYKKEAKLSYIIPRWTEEFRLNAQLQWQIELIDAPKQPVEIQFNPKSLAEDSKSEVIIRGKTSQGQNYKETRTLEACEFASNSPEI